MIIELDEFTRVEGNGKAEIVIENGEVKDARVKIVEGPRFFEILTLGRDYWDVPDLEARICAICYIAHSVASVRAIEKALGIDVPESVEKLRELALWGEIIESHALHLYLLALPDVFGYPDAISMIPRHGELVKEGLTIKAFGNAIRELIGGREIHGINIKPGGFGRYPSEEELEKIAEHSKSLIKFARRIVGIFASQEAGGAVGEVLMATSDYLWGDELIINGERVQYYEVDEVPVGYSFAKHSYYKGNPVFVGALPRLLLKGESIEGEAARMLEEYRDKLESKYVIYNNLAQAIELLYALERVPQLVEEILSEGIERGNGEISQESGEGVGYVEAPRGVLVHHYRIENGKVVWSNTITPTAFNQRLMELSLLEEAKRLYGSESEENMKKRLEVIVRAFDPCISCSVHFVKL
ncbi:hydrogenase [Pyrococcus furiosus DSM 3638]|uniref:Sulfhydrogenase 2 subunit alpha n=3 Tax=Pyrococcus furiosus TaxID=2261 RepID=HYD2A_PYRFU|nr:MULTISPECIES: NAD(P)-dependent hydrogenase/sulfhydrogenase 2 subunit alpha [Pyrococcus]E7FHC4.1 RecName: Full=Sulfhydrogenase 2 subunit alpha; AltName: Full=Hydrogen dehydrogenase (NAD(P)(+)); AltName: Full=Hydrogenase-II subunit alpha; Short=H-II alpha; AltName: Full=NADP-reducing hydrogenase subunit ShyA; AltName: Full=Sulfhydrogenase II subunit alpha [Pyrococcus furiosus DSM 3638]AAF61854.1 sulfhydrogenase II subunit a [Pyrococcus furiosus DSM 3638]AAL81456.1 H-II alpha (hydrogenase subuni